MAVFKKLLKQFNEPYPGDFYLAHTIKTGLFIGGFVSLFFFIFEPFGLSELPRSAQSILYAGYGLIALLCIFYNDFFLPKLFPQAFKEKSWKIWKHILFTSWITLNIGLASYFLTRIAIKMAGYSPQNVSFTYVVKGAFFIAVFPITIITLIKLNMLLRQNQTIINESNPLISSHRSQLDGTNPDSKIIITAENEKDSFSCNLSDLIYISAEENYVDIFYQEEKTVRQLIRSSLSRVQEQLQLFHPQLFRCHRTYLINMDKIVSLSGNAQGLKLQLENVSLTIPVSRRYVSQFRQIIKNFA